MQKQVYKFLDKKTDKASEDNKRINKRPSSDHAYKKLKKKYDKKGKS